MSLSQREPHLDHARKLVLDWLRAPHRNPTLLSTATESELAQQHAVIADCFMIWARAAGFGCDLVDTSLDGAPAYETHWTHNGTTFVGFKQPRPEKDPADARLAGCAALLRNEWCRARLPA